MNIFAILDPAPLSLTSPGFAILDLTALGLAHLRQAPSNSPADGLHIEAAGQKNLAILYQATPDLTRLSPTLPRPTETQPRRASYIANRHLFDDLKANNVKATHADGTTADRTYLERVWLNRVVRSSKRAFDAEHWKELARPDYCVPAGALITLGFDGSRFNDATAIVGTEITTGYQWLIGLWERPQNIENWEVPEDEVDDAIADAFKRWEVWRLYADPPYWESTIAKWAGQFGTERIFEWWTNRPKQMAYAIKAFSTAISTGELSHDGSLGLMRHIGNACRRVLTLRDETGVPLWTMYKDRPDSPFKIDAAMAAVLSFEARNDALAAGIGQPSIYETRDMLVLG